MNSNGIFKLFNIFGASFSKRGLSLAVSLLALFRSRIYLFSSLALPQPSAIAHVLHPYICPRCPITCRALENSCNDLANSHLHPKGNFNIPVFGLLFASLVVHLAELVLALHHCQGLKLGSLLTALGIALPYQ
jgi:hypothetical protein